jgi:type VII secretion-associated serine protease mycosin
VNPRRFGAIIALAAVLGLSLPSTAARADNVRDAQWHLKFLRIPEAQQLANGGEGVTVAVIDSGVDANHPDLIGNVLLGTDFVAIGGNGQTDTYGHGTSMAGIIAGHGHGDAGAMGIAPKAKILPARTGNGVHNSGQDVRGVEWASHSGAKVMCLAYASPDAAGEERRVIEQAQAADIVLVAGVGNVPATKVGYPAAYPGVVASAGVDRQGNHADISVVGGEVMLAAPAVDIISTSPNGKYNKGVGTSAATAIIAGVAALVRAKYPKLSAQEVIHRLTATAIDKGPPGRDDQYGYGIVDPVAALTADVPPLTPSTAPARGGPDPAPPMADESSSSSRLPTVLIGTLVGLFLAAGAVTAFVVVRRARRA